MLASVRNMTALYMNVPVQLMDIGRRYCVAMSRSSGVDVR